jgi:hypothetical protein
MGACPITASACNPGHTNEFSSRHARQRAPYFLASEAEEIYRLQADAEVFNATIRGSPRFDKRRVGALSG